MNVKVLIIERLRLLQISMLRMSYQKPKGHSTMSGQGSILNILKDRGSISRSELGVLLSMSRPALAELLRKMESRGLISRSRDGSDHRRVIITLTREGKEAAKSSNIEKSPLPHMLDCLDGKELSEFNSYLERILKYNAQDDIAGHDFCFECPGPDKCSRDYLKYGHDRPNPDYCKYSDQFPF